MIYKCILISQDRRKSYRQNKKNRVLLNEKSVLNNKLMNFFDTLEDFRLPVKGKLYQLCIIQILIVHIDLLDGSILISRIVINTFCGIDATRVKGMIHSIFICHNRSFNHGDLLKNTKILLNIIAFGTIRIKVVF